MEAAFMFSAHP